MREEYNILRNNIECRHGPFFLFSRIIQWGGGEKIQDRGMRKESRDGVGETRE